MKNAECEAQDLVEQLQEVLKLLDENALAIPAIKIEEAINALKQDGSEKS